MIKLFRHIRRRLLAENRFTRYLLYAIGEIVLVVVGILIAVQINSWNQHRMDQRTVSQYRANLIEDLVADSIAIEEALAGIRVDSARLADIGARVAASDAPLDTIRQIARSEYIFYIWLQPEYRMDTYQVLGSTGDIGLFDQELIRALNALHNAQQRALRIGHITLENYRNSLLEYERHYPVPFEGNLLRHDSRAAELIWEVVSLSEHATRFNALVLSKGDNYRVSLTHLSDLQAQSNELLYILKRR
ncbi:MAG: hypothetical protein KDC00_08310 [Flavobacteriales bacterium]|nr:hypothetical protein [Flavobacteriales bacterium]